MVEQFEEHRGRLRAVVRGAHAVASNAVRFKDSARVVTPALVNGGPGVVITLEGRVLSVMAFTVVGGRVVAIDSLSDPARLARLDIPGLID